jgi:immune inhibitor A
MKNNKTLLIVILVVLALCCCVIVVLGGAYFGLREFQKYIPTLTSDIPTIPSIPSDNGNTPTPFVVTRQPVDQIPSDTLSLLEQISIPDAELPDIVCHLKDVCGVPLTEPGPSSPLTVGKQEQFWLSDTDTNEDYQVTATLRYITDHVYFWAENSANYNDSDMRKLIDTFENKIYPTDREFFGTEWTPGVDGDVHLYILYASGIGYSVAGYFSSTDEYLPAVREHSNTHEMFVINTSQSLGDEYTYSTLAHEFQHMIHWYQDRNEGELLDEGFSELASFLNGYDTGGFDWYYSTDPDLNLTDWLPNAGDNTAHYGANFIFTNYFLNRFGKEATQALVHDQANGLDSVDQVLSQRGITDPVTGAPITTDDFFQDWTLANFLQDSSVGDGRYSYPNYSSAPQTGPTETFTSCPLSASTRTVNQYGVDYISFTCSGSYTIHFTGATSVPLVPADPHSGTYAFWSNKGNNSDMTLTQEFDFTSVSSPISITYWTWYDLEKDYDYLYLETSTDGEHWQILTTPSGTSDNPTGSSFGWGYTGESNGWVEETVDLSQFAGQKISLRFEYVTDMAVNGEGLLLDDVSIPAIGYSTDFESDDGGWTSAGFARIENVIPQTFRLALVTKSSSGTTVQYIALAVDQTADVPFTVGQNGVNEVTLVVSGTARFTRSTAGYQFEVR